MEGKTESSKIHDWRSHQLTSDYLEGVRGGIPLAAVQIELIIRILKAYMPGMKTFIDLGCGDGILGRNLYPAWPATRGIFVDFSEPMLQAAREKCSMHPNQSEFCPIDYGEEHWPDKIPVPEGGIDVVISGYSIHHQEDKRKYEIYRDIFNLLNPGGIFLNLEHVASRSATGEKLFDEFFIDSLWDFHQKNNLAKSRDEVAAQFYNREDKVLNKLTDTEIQCDWLREIGFSEVDCFFKLYELSLFGGQKPRSANTTV